MRKAGSASPPGVLASRLDAEAFNTRPGDHCRLRSTTIQEGVVLQSWDAVFAEPLQMEIIEDSECIHFTYVLEGGAHIEIPGRWHGRDLAASPATGVIHFCPGERGRFRQEGVYSSIVVMVRPDVFHGWDETAGSRMGKAVERGRCLLGELRGDELHTQAWRLRQALVFSGPEPEAGSPGGRRGSLQAHIQGLGFVAAFLERAGDALDGRPALSREDRLRLLRARDLLLSDLAAPPTLSELSSASGLGLLKLKRGFRTLFGNSVYGLFMQERMLEARRRLLRGGSSVTEVATGLGYTNISHFSAAFRKRFGMNPGAIRN